MKFEGERGKERKEERETRIEEQRRTEKNRAD